jgi:hypothetical protein
MNYVLWTVLTVSLASLGCSHAAPETLTAQRRVCEALRVRLDNQEELSIDFADLYCRHSQMLAKAEGGTPSALAAHRRRLDDLYDKVKGLRDGAPQVIENVIAVYRAAGG